MLGWVKIKNQRDVTVYTSLSTIISIVLSLTFTLGSLYWVEPEALELPTTYIVAVLVPLLVAPFVTSFALHLVLKLEQTKKQLEVISQTDALTKIYNRGFFWERVEQELVLAHKKHSPVSLIIFDIDNFKSFNDTYGHLVGDQILQHCAQSAARCLRKGDYIARYGGEEFAVFLNDCATHPAKDIGERIRQSIADINLLYDQQNLKITVSLGLVTSFGQNSLETLAKQADKAMYQAKHQGKNCVAALEL